MGYKFYKMKKLILSLVFLLAVGVSFINASSNDEVLPNSKEAIEVVEEFGCASDCVSWAKERVFEIAYDANQHPNDEPLYMEIYMRDYSLCYKVKC